MKQKSPLIIIFLVIFIDLLGFGIVIPILPYYAKSFGASATELGWLMMCYSGMQFLFSPLWGRLSDHFGRRPIILTGILGLGGALVILGMARSFAWLLAGRLLAGFFGANVSSASAYIADVTPPEQRAKGMGLIGAAFGLGFLFGPAIGGLLSHWGYGTAALAAAGLSAVNFIFALFKLKEPPLSEEVRESHRPKITRKFWIDTMASPQKSLVIMIFFIVTMGVAQLETSFALFLLQKFDLDAYHAGFILAGMAFIMATIQGGGMGRLAKKFGEKKLLTTGLALMAVSLLAVSYIDYLSLIISFFMIQAVGYALTNPSLMSLLSRQTESNIQGGTMGIFHSAGSLGRIVGPLVAGYLFDHMGSQVPFLGAAILFAVAFAAVVVKGRIWNVGAS